MRYNSPQVGASSGNKRNFSGRFPTCLMTKSQYNSHQVTKSTQVRLSTEVLYVQTDLFQIALAKLVEPDSGELYHQIASNTVPAIKADSTHQRSDTH